jgi:hypothetical protein
VSHTFGIGLQMRISVFGEVFNLLNTANLVGFSGNPANANVFGRPNARFTQVFGSAALAPFSSVRV